MSTFAFPAKADPRYRSQIYEMRTTVSDVSVAQASACLSRVFAEQTRLNGLRSCLGRKLVGAKGTMY